MFTITYITGPRVAYALRVVTTPSAENAWATYHALKTSDAARSVRLWQSGALVG